MSLTHLAQRVRQLKALQAGETNLDWHDFALKALQEEFGVDPSSAEVRELANAARASRRPSVDFFTDVDDEEDEDEPERELQTGGGRRVVRKPETLAG